MRDADAPDWINGDPEDLRRWRNTCPEVVNPVLPEDVSIAPFDPEDGCPGGLRFMPAKATGTPVVYFHGGGFVVGSPETHRINAAWIASLARAPVYSIRYRLAPENPLPAQAEDAVAAVRARLCSYPRARLMGDSAGGLVALWAFAGLAGEERVRIEDAILFYPGGGTSVPRPATLGDDETQGLGPKSLAAYQRRLDPKGIAKGNPLYDPAAPGFAFPPRMTVVGGGSDPILYQSEALSQQAGAVLVIAQGQPHSFLAALPTEPAITHLRRALGLAPC
ncbi:alpha/beta hydrolase fold domain-containing protein [Tabrizicola sp.]|uniref:alpha/beta hydrolase fold domain-containing protein n=1 Tax=Tabrizicola sp. TaxID=2005166 RepID=UPI002FDE56F4